MSYQRERESFLLTMARYGMSADVARLILRHATTYQRLAERECNGDDWCEGDTKMAERYGMLVKCSESKVKGHGAMPCATCGSPDVARQGHALVTRSSVRMTQIERRIRELVDCTNEPLRVEFQGDPRGYCIRVLIQDGNGVVREYGAPVRSR